MPAERHDLEKAHVIRAAAPADLIALQAVIASTRLFPAELLAGMMSDHFEGQGDGGLWFVLTLGPTEPVALAYCAPERMTVGTWNLLLIAVHADRQGDGLGSALLRHVEAHLTLRGERLLLVETSALPEFERARDFYGARGFDREARLRDFYQAGEDKLVFRKALPDGGRPR